MYFLWGKYVFFIVGKTLIKMWFFCREGLTQVNIVVREQALGCDLSVGKVCFFVGKTLIKMWIFVGSV